MCDITYNKFHVWQSLNVLQCEGSDVMIVSFVCKFVLSATICVIFKLSRSLSKFFRGDAMTVKGTKRNVSGFMLYN